MAFEDSLESQGRASTSSITDGKTKSFICNACNNCYCSYSSLKRHVRNKHPNEIKDLAQKLRGSKLFKCDFCLYRFNHKRNLRFHIKKVHNTADSNDWNGHSESIKECPVCNFKAGKNEMHEHFENAHDIKTQTTVFNFDKYDSFDEWKENLEKETSSKFIKMSGAYSSKEATTSYFICHRSGYYVCKGTSQRNIKTQGSNKINGYCPAGMKLEIYENGACKVTFCSTHVGHKNDIRYLMLSDSERQYIAAKIASKTPFKAILDDIQDSVTPSKLERIHLLTKKDLHNIKKCFNIGSEAETVTQENDYLSIDNEDILSQEESFLISDVGQKVNEPSTSSLSFLEQKENFKKELLEISNDVRNEEELDIFKIAIKSAKQTITAYRNSKAKNLMRHEKEAALITHNENIEAQRRMLTTQKRKRNSENTLKNLM